MARIKRTIAFIVLFCLASGHEARGEDLNLSLEGGVRLVLENNLDIRIEKVSPEMAAEKIRAEQGSFDPELSTSFRFEDSTTPLTTRSTIAAGGRAAVKSESYSMNAGLSGKTPLGTGYSLEFSDTWTADTFNRYDYEYDSFAGLTLTQPLLKNLGRAANRYAIETAGLDRDMSVLRLKSRILDSLAGYALAYWDLVSARAELKVRQDALSLAAALRDENKKRFEADVASMLDVIQAEAGAAKRREDVIMAEKTVRARENALKRFISADVLSLRDTRIIPTDEALYEEVDHDLDKSVKQAFASRSDYMETRTGIEKSRIKAVYSKNQAYPSLDLEASYGFNGLGEDLGDSIRGMDTNPEWSLGLVFTYPLGNRRADSGMRTARFEEAQALIRLKKLEQEIVLAIDDALKALLAAKERIEAARESVRYAEESLRAEKIKLAEGLSTTYNVLELDQDLSSARIGEIGALIDYNKARVDLGLATGGLVKEMGVDVKEASLEKHRSTREETLR